MSFNPVLVVVKIEKPGWYKSLSTNARADSRIAVRQLATTLIPYLLFALMIGTVRLGSPSWITLALGLIATPFFTRIFIFFHDCAHGSFLPSPRRNRDVAHSPGS